MKVMKASSNGALLLLVVLLMEQAVGVRAQLFGWAFDWVSELLGVFCMIPLLGDAICEPCDSDGCSANGVCERRFLASPRCVCNVGWSGTSCLARLGGNLLQGVSLPTILSVGNSDTYASCDALKGDLTTAALYTSDAMIERMARIKFANDWSYGGLGSPIFVSGPGIPGGPILASPVDEADGSGGNAADIPTTETSFETNNQIKGVDEADKLKSNGVKAFAVYGREIVEFVVATNSVQSRTVLPEIETPDDNDWCGRGGEIVGMLLIEKSLIVFAREYAYYCYYGPFPEAASMPPDSQPIVQSDGATKVYLYDIDNMDGGPASVKELDGDYLSARSIQGQVYVVTTNRLDTYQLTHSYDIFNEEIYPAGLTEAEFRAKAEDQARLVVGPFVDRLVSELGDCGSVQQITLMQNTIDPIAFSDVLGSMVNVESFSVNGLTMSTPVVRSMMLPPSSYNVFASQDYLVVAARGYNWRNSAVGEETFLMAYMGLMTEHRSRPRKQALCPAIV